MLTLGIWPLRLAPSRSKHCQQTRSSSGCQSPTLCWSSHLENPREERSGGHHWGGISSRAGGCAGRGRRGRKRWRRSKNQRKDKRRRFPESHSLLHSLSPFIINSLEIIHYRFIINHLLYSHEPPGCKLSIPPFLHRSGGARRTGGLPRWPGARGAAGTWAPPVQPLHPLA